MKLDGNEIIEWFSSLLTLITNRITKLKKNLLEYDS